PRSTLFPYTTLFRSQPLLDTLKRALAFRSLFGKFGRRGIPAAIIDGLLRRKFRGTKRGVGDTEIVAAVKEVVAELAGWEVRVAGGDNGDAAMLHVTGP